MGDEIGDPRRRVGRNAHESGPWREADIPTNVTRSVEGGAEPLWNQRDREAWLGEKIPPNFLRREVFPDGGRTPTSRDVLLGNLLGVPPFGHVRTTFPHTAVGFPPAFVECLRVELARLTPRRARRVVRIGGRRRIDQSPNGVDVQGVGAVTEVDQIWSNDEPSVPPAPVVLERFYARLNSGITWASPLSASR